MFDSGVITVYLYLEVSLFTSTKMELKKGQKPDFIDGKITGIHSS